MRCNAVNFSVFGLAFFLLFYQPPQAQAGNSSISHFGLVVNPYNQDWQEPDKTTQILQELGIRLVISKLSWNDIEPEKGKYSQEGWEKFDGLVNRLADLGIEIMVFISDTPEWAIDAQLSPADWEGEKFGPPAKNPQDLADFFAQAVKRYKDKIKLWAFYNAPQNKNHWTEPKVLAEMYRLGRQVLKKYQPEGKLVMSGLESARDNGPIYLEGFLKAGGGEYIDMYDFHMALGDNTFSSLESSAARYNKILDKYGEGPKPIQYGAVGYPSIFNPSENLIDRFKKRGWKPIDYASMTPESQANLLVKIIVIGRSLGAQRIFWTRSRDAAPASGAVYDRWLRKIKKGKKEMNIETEINRTRGIIDYVYQRKPSFTAFKYLINRLDKADIFKTLNLGPDVKGVIFREGDKYTGVFFALEGGKTLALGTSSGHFRIFDINGREKDTVIDKNGSLILEISDIPIYVEGSLKDIVVN